MNKKNRFFAVLLCFMLCLSSLPSFASVTGGISHGASEGVDEVAGVNLALNKPVACSSEHATYTAAKAVDGTGGTSAQNYWVPSANNPSWLAVNLGKLYNVTKVVLKVRNTWVDRTQTIKILGGQSFNLSNGQAYNEANHFVIVDSANYALGTTSGIVREINIPGGAATSYILLYCTYNSDNNNRAQIQLEVYGESIQDNIKKIDLGGLVIAKTYDGSQNIDDALLSQYYSDLQDDVVLKGKFADNANSGANKPLEFWLEGEDIGDYLIINAPITGAIAKIVPVITSDAEQHADYDGNAKAVTAAIDNELLFVVSYYASEQDRAAGKNALTAPADAGTYYARVSFAGNTNYSEVSKDVVFTIGDGNGGCSGIATGEAYACMIIPALLLLFLLIKKGRFSAKKGAGS